MKKGKLILDTPNCRIFLTQEGYEVMIRMQQPLNTWVRNNPHSPDLRGLIGAMQLATDVLAGKFWPRDVKSFSDDELAALEYSTPLLEGRKS